MAPLSATELEDAALLRALLAWGNDPCVHCGLQSADMARCGMGFPGCARSADMGKFPLRRGWARWTGRERRLRPVP